MLTLAQRPQANAIAERNGGKVTRHLRALLIDKVLQGLQSVLLPLTTLHRLMQWASTYLDRGIFEPFREAKEFRDGHMCDSWS